MVVSSSFDDTDKCGGPGGTVSAVGDFAFFCIEEGPEKGLDAMREGNEFDSGRDNVDLEL